MNAIQHYGNPLHVCCRIVELLGCLGFNYTMKQVKNHLVMRIYAGIFQRLAY